MAGNRINSRSGNDFDRIMCGVHGSWKSHPRAYFNRLKLHPFVRIENSLREILTGAGAKPAAGQVLVERPRRPEMGDIASPAALRLAGQAGCKPLELARQLADQLVGLPEVAAAEPVAPGFVNIELTGAALAEPAALALADRQRFGRPAAAGGSVLLEYVSSNPTGPLHVGHGRAAAYGDSVARILKHAGWQVATEYYLNDRGRQVDILAASLWLRIMELRGHFAGPMPAGCYAGEYLREVAAGVDAVGSERGDGQMIDVTNLPAAADAAALEVVHRVRQRLGDRQLAELAELAVGRICAGMKQELARFRVGFDNWFSEKEMIESGKLTPALDKLAAAGATYRKDGALWFAASRHGDEKDRVLVKSDGAATYFASDVAYHLDKYGRGFDRYVNIFGADHHGYVARLRGFIAALGEEPGKLEVPLVQIVALVRAGQRLKITTRGGVFSTLAELVDAVGVDAARLFFVLNRPDAQMEFDLDLAVRESAANPVYYLQYAHARCCSVLARWGGERSSLQLDASALIQPAERSLLVELAWFESTVRSAAAELAPHLVASWLYELARKLHAVYEGEPIIGAPEPQQRARLALIAAAAGALATGLDLLGVAAPNKMERRT